MNNFLQLREHGGLKGLESERRGGLGGVEMRQWRCVVTFIALVPYRKHRALSVLCRGSPSPLTPVPSTDSICFERGVHAW